jgi:hypothetical protein
MANVETRIPLNPVDEVKVLTNPIIKRIRIEYPRIV